MIILEGNPLSTNTLYRRHRNVIYLTNEGKQMKEYYWRMAKLQWGRPVSQQPFQVYIKLFFKDVRKRDIDNFNKILLDSLTGVVWFDDCQIVKMTIEKHINKKYPRIEIDIQEHKKPTLTSVFH